MQTYKHSSTITHEYIDDISLFSASIGLMTLHAGFHSLITKKDYISGSIVSTLVGAGIAIPYLTHLLMRRKGKASYTVLSILNRASVLGTMIGAGCSFIALLGKDYQIATPYFLSLAANSALLISTGIKKRNSENVFLEAAQKNNHRVLKACIKQGVNLNSTDNKDNTALDLAFRNHCTESIEILIKAGATQCKFENYIIAITKSNDLTIRLLNSHQFFKNFNQRTNIYDLTLLVALISRHPALKISGHPIASIIKDTLCLFESNLLDIELELLAEHGHFETFRIFVEILNIPITQNAITRAYNNNHHNIVEYSWNNLHFRLH